MQGHMERSKLGLLWKHQYTSKHKYTQAAIISTVSLWKNNVVEM